MLNHILNELGFLCSQRLIKRRTNTRGHGSLLFMDSTEVLTNQHVSGRLGDGVMELQVHLILKALTSVGHSAVVVLNYSTINIFEPVK